MQRGCHIHVDLGVGFGVSFWLGKTTYVNPRPEVARLLLAVTQLTGLDSPTHIQVGTRTKRGGPPGLPREEIDKLFLRFKP